MTGNRRALLVTAAFGLALLAPAASRATSVTIFFDNAGPEEGITTLGTSEFSFMGSRWTGGRIATFVGVQPGFPLGEFGYLVKPFAVGLATVTFDEPVDFVEFFFVAGTAEVSRGSATAFDVGGNNLLSVSVEHRDLHDVLFEVRDGFVRLDPDEPIARIEFTGGFIDNFTFTLVPEPGAGALVALGATLLAASRSRKRNRLDAAAGSHEASRR